MRGQVFAELYKLKKPKRRKSRYKPVSDSHVDWQKTAHEAKRELTWGRFIFFAVVLSLFLFLSVALFSSRQVPNPVTRPEVLKRSIIGTYHHISLKHLHRYVNEAAFRFKRGGDVKNKLMDRIEALCCKMVGVRLSYVELIG